MISKNQIKFVRQLEQKKFRHREGVFVAEGTKVVGDLLKAGFTPSTLFATKEWLNCELSIVNCQLIEVSPDDLRRLSFLQHPQQVLALFPIPSQNCELPARPEGALSSERIVNCELQIVNCELQIVNCELSIALDGIQDPGNLGTIIRIADWFGISNIICSEDTVDAWNPKVVQATMGSIARVNIIYNNLPEFLDTLPSDFPVYGTFLDGENIYTQELTPHGLIIMGNEGNGISDAVRAKVNRRLLIPDFHQGETADSLNVAIATAITVSEFRRR